MYTQRRSDSRAWCAALVFVLATFAGTALADPADRVARVSFLRGNVSFQPSGDDQWAQMSLNRPLTTGDKVYTDRDSRVELEIGSADIRLDQGSTFDLLNLDDNVAQIELTDGVLALHVGRVGEGQSYEVDTPTLAFVVNQPGDYRIDVSPQGDSTMVTVFAGGGNVYGENNASYSVRSGSSYRFNDSALRDYEVLDLPRADDFDQWVSSRNARYERAVSRRYVSEDVIGYADLDDYGSWSTAPDYGNVWYPTTVAADWAPYRSGHWSWIDPWGWTWVDSAAWGFAPFHYGRWAYIGNRWGWCPGAYRGRSIYAPAMVAFVGGGGWGSSVSIGIGGPVGWFPLGPRDVYVPWYRASRGYFTNINVRNTTVINNTYITNVYNNYSNGRPINNVNYAYRTNAAAFTAVPRDAFVGARPVNAARVQINANNLRSAQVVSRVGIEPTRASFVRAGAVNTRAVPPAAAFNRGVIARTAPPARAMPIADRLQAIQRNGAQPLANNQLRDVTSRPAAGAQPGRAGAAPSRVQVVGQNARAPQPLPMRGAAAQTRPGSGANERTSPAGTTRPMPGAAATPSIGGRTSISAPGNRASAPPEAPNRSALPSSRFAPHNGAAGRRGPENGNNPAVQPANRGNVNPPVRGAQTTPTAPSTRGVAAPSERFTPRSNTPSGPAAQQRNSPAVERQTPSPASRNMAPTHNSPRTPSSMEQRSFQQRNAPQVQQRAAPVEQQRSTPQFQQRNAPAMRERSAPAQQYQQRSAPVVQQRSAPQPQYQQRSAPAVQQRAAPQQQYQQRSAPAMQQRNAPQPAQQRAQPQQRERAQRNENDKDKDHR